MLSFLSLKPQMNCTPFFWKNREINLNLHHVVPVTREQADLYSGILVSFRIMHVEMTVDGSLKRLSTITLCCKILASCYNIQLIRLLSEPGWYLEKYHANQWVAHHVLLYTFSVSLSFFITFYMMLTFICPVLVKALVVLCINRHKASMWSPSAGSRPFSEFH